MSFEKIKAKIFSILEYYEIENIEPVLFTLSQYDTILKIERDLEICNKILLGKELESWNERYLNYPFQDSEVVIEPNEKFVTISIDFIFDNGDVIIPVWLFISLLELVISNLKLNGALFHENHVVVEKGNYCQGKRDGKWMKFYKSEQIQKISYFDNGQPTGIWEEFFENGNLKSKQNFNFEDYRNRLLLEWRENGIPKTNWTTIITSEEEIEFKHNGITKRKWRLKSGNEVIEKIDYNEDGTIQWKNYLNLKGNLAEGEHLYFDTSGKLEIKRIMKNGEEKIQ